MKKNRNLCSLVVTFCASAATTMALQSCQCQPSEPFTALSPAPQEIVWSEQVVNTPKSIVLVGADEADTDAVALLRGTFAEGKGLSVIIGERGDEAVSAYADQIPDKVEGYYIHVGADQIVVAGADEACTYYGVQTLLQMASQPKMKQAEVKDWPDVLERGVVEGFYGNPWSHKDRLRQFDFYGKNKLNVYIYGPKDDPYHRNQWR